MPFEVRVLRDIGLGADSVGIGEKGLDLSEEKRNNPDNDVHMGMPGSHRGKGTSLIPFTSADSKFRVACVARTRMPRRVSMTSNVPEPNAPSVAGSVEPSQEPASVARRKVPALLVALIAGIVASGLTWVAGEAFRNRFQAEVEGDPSRGPTASQVSAEAVYMAEMKNGVLVYGLQGGLLGLLLGLAGGFGRGSARAAVVAGVVGLVGGGALGTLVSWGLIPPLLRNINPLSDDLLQPMLAHAGLWSPIGAAVGLAFGLGYGGERNRVLSAIAGGFLGALLAVVIYEVLGAVVFPLDRTTRPIAASSVARLVAHALLGVVASLGTAFFLGSISVTRARR